jgi:hypothetical protein
MARGGKKTAATRKKTSRKRAPLKKAASPAKKAVSSAKQKLLKKGVKKKAAAPKAAAPRTAPKKVARPPKRESDIPMDKIEKVYAPHTSVKAGFRADGRDRQKDQELVGGDAGDKWKDEDRFTNKSGDPRIGTHGRTYEPGEKKRKKTDFETE